MKNVSQVTTFRYTMKSESESVAKTVPDDQTVAVLGVLIISY